MIFLRPHLTSLKNTLKKELHREFNLPYKKPCDAVASSINLWCFPSAKKGINFTKIVFLVPSVQLISSKIRKVISRSRKHSVWSEWIENNIFDAKCWHFLLAIFMLVALFNSINCQKCDIPICVARTMQSMHYALTLSF